MDTPLKPTGFLISFEGLDYSGKTTQVKLLADALTAAGKRIVRVREPGGTALGEKLRHLLKHDPECQGMSNPTELFILLASRAELVDKVIAPALAEGAIVICDRFSDSTIAYQAYGRGMDDEMVHMASSAAAFGLVPDLTFYLRVSPEVSKQRAASRATDQPDRFDVLAQDFKDRVRFGYEEIVAFDKDRHNTRPHITTVDADLDTAVVHQLIMLRLGQLLA